MTFTAAAHAAAAHVAPLAASTPSTTSNVNDVEPGVLAFLIVAAMGVALVFLLRSMNKQFRKIGPKPEDEILDLLEMARRPDPEEDEDGPAPENAVPGEVVADEAPAREASAREASRRGAPQATDRE